MNNTKTYDLISNVISSMNSYENDSSIKSMALSCNVPIEYMRKLMLSILNNQILQECINVINDFDSNHDSSFMERYLEHPDIYSNNLLKGDYDELLWEINLNILDFSESELLSLSQIEYVAITLLGEDILSIKRGSVFEKKDTINPISPAIRKNQEIIQTAINNKQELVFSYKKADGTLSTKRCFPKEIFANISDNWLYFCSTENKSYRLDRISHSCMVVKSDSPYPYVNEDPNQKYLWGIYKNEDDKPVHVKLKIYPETKNLISKISRDVRLRKETCKLYQEDDFYYYEDDIIGIHKFQRWLRGYGSSIEVIEPVSLRDTVIEQAKRTLSYYSVSKKWLDL